MSKLNPMRFIAAEIANDEETGTAITYKTGFNCSGNGQNEVLQHVRHADGTEHTFVIMRGMARAKAEAVVLILNAPDEA